MDCVFFLGACTPKGFYSHYGSFLQEADHLTVIKGGPGCGKSTFMRAIGREAQKRGLDVTYILCASDPDSLDGIFIPSLSAAYVDGTAPHVLEPPLCGGSRNYLNFGEFYRSQAMRSNEAEILALQKENAAQYPYVTACLTAAEGLTAALRHAAHTAEYVREAEAIGECLALSALRPVGNSGKRLHRFLSAPTPKGLYFCEKTPGQLCKKVYVLKDNYLLAPKLLSLLAQKAEALGHSCIYCHSALQPDGAPVHLLLPQADTAFVSESRDFPYRESCFCRIDLDSTLPLSLRRDLEFYQKSLSPLLYQAVAHLRQAKRLHDGMELLCRPFVDFQAVEAMTQKTLQQLFPC